MLLKDKVAIVTGAAEGIGAGVAELFAAHGAKVYLGDIMKEAVEARAAGIREKGAEAFAHVMDVSKRDQVEAVAAAAMARHGRIDVLVNNAGIYPRQRFLEMTEDEWDQMQEVNVKSMFYTCRAVAPRMAAQGSGHIVNISSVTFFLGTVNLSHYVASKGAVVGLTRSLARELGAHNVHVNCVTPGAILTYGETAMKLPQEQIDWMVEMQSLKRRLYPKDIANVCLFLCSELSDGMTGQTLNVDAGWVMH